MIAPIKPRLPFPGYYVPIKWLRPFPCGFCDFPAKPFITRTKDGNGAMDYESCPVHTPQPLLDFNPIGLCPTCLHPLDFTVTNSHTSWTLNGMLGLHEWKVTLWPCEHCGAVAAIQPPNHSYILPKKETATT